MAALLAGAIFLGPAARASDSADPARAAASLFAVPESPSILSPSALAAIIDRHYNALRSLSATFTQQYDGMGLHRSETGTLLLKKAGRLAASGQMRWTYTKPAGKLFVLDGHNAYFYTPGQNEIARVASKKLDDLRSPLAFLLGHASLSKQLGNAAVTAGANGTQVLSGVPRGMEQRVASLAITALQDGTITAMRVEETDGAINLFQLSHQEPNVAVPADAFVFRPPPGTQVVEGMPPL